jgi:hypothetical protein
MQKPATVVLRNARQLAEGKRSIPLLAGGF